MLEQWERGYVKADGNICSNCVEDATLKRWVTDNAAAYQCRFCSASSEKPIAASFDAFVGVVLAGVRFDWNHPDAEGIGYESAEGGYQADVTEIGEVLTNYEISECPDVTEAIIKAVGHDGWVERDYYIGDKSRQLSIGWDWFQYIVKHQTRYVFLAPNDDDDITEMPPSNMLYAIGGMVVNELAALNLITETTIDTDLYRVRIGPLPYHTGTEIGSPPAELSIQSNRMSPAGIAMFYGAFDQETALAETLDLTRHVGQMMSIGTFRPVRSLRVLDLADLPDIPSVFDVDGHLRIHPLRFLHSFSHDMAQPIAHDGREHIEYVPTQIVTEYFRRVFRDDHGNAIDGIIDVHP